ncbi:MAG: penicillin-binding protein 2 [Deltaproteobacteria bacterium]|nr:penicillin-binding protein 2 [Deltaproteobacteria bacterium]
MLPLRPSPRTLPEFRGRTRFFTLLALVAFAFLGYRLWMLQILQGQQYAVMSESNRIRLERIPAVRGLVFDRNQQLLIKSRPSFDVRYAPGEAGDRPATLRHLADLLDADADELAETARHTNRSKGVTLLRDVDWPAVVAVETHQLDLPGIEVSVKARRSYLTEDMTAHILGYLGEISTEQLRGLRRKGYRRGDEIGQSGLEKRWEEHLAGRSGGERVEVDAVGRKVRVIDRLRATPGHNVVLTLDLNVQQAAYDALQDREGAVVVLDVNTGAVRALVSTPAFNPNAFARGLTAREWHELTNDSETPLHNRTLQGHFPPGSTFKIMTALAALQEGAISPHTRLFCGGTYKVGNRVLRDWKKHGHGNVNMHQALVQSCDVYFYQVAQRLGVDKMAKWARRFGLGSPTGIGLESESPGLVPDRAWKKRRFGTPWYPGETPLVGIGQGFIGATPLQMASMVAAVANGGTVYRPWFVRKVVSPDGEMMEEYGPVRAATVNLKKGTLEIVRRALFDVVHGRRGTARRARSDLVEIAGKTGTAQVAEMRGEAVKSADLPYEIRDHAWFVAYAPADEPEIAVAILVEHGGGGGSTAAPIARAVVEAWFLSGDDESEDIEMTDAQLTALFTGPRPRHAN